MCMSISEGVPVSMDHYWLCQHGPLVLSAWTSGPVSMDHYWPCQHGPLTLSAWTTTGCVSMDHY